MIYLTNAQNEVVAKSVLVDPTKDELKNINDTRFLMYDLQYKSTTELNGVLKLIHDNNFIGYFLVLDLQNVRQASEGPVAEVVILEKVNG